MASIGCVCIQRPIKLHSHGGKCDTERLPTLYIHICLYWLTLASVWTPTRLFHIFASLFICHIIYSTLFIHLPLSKISSLFLVFWLSCLPDNTIGLFHPIFSSPLPCILFYMLHKCITFCPALHNVAPTPPPHSLAQNHQIAPYNELERHWETAVLMLWYEILSQATLKLEFHWALTLCWTMIIRQGNPNKDVSC